MKPFMLLPALLVVLSCTAERPAEPALFGVAGRCEYKYPGSEQVECRDYIGEWDTLTAVGDCASWQGTFYAGRPCNPIISLGQCVMPSQLETASYKRLVIRGNDATRCGAVRSACETYGRGVFDPTGLCATQDGVVTQMAHDATSTQEG